jgi:hypothetical protein
MRIKLNGKATLASEPTCGRKTLDGMLLNSLSYFGEEQLCENFSPEAESAGDFSNDAPEALGCHNNAATLSELPQSGAFWQFGQELEQALVASEQEANNQEVQMDLRMTPSPEVFRSNRGTIEFVRHQSGTYVKPTYNNCGMLIRVDLNGLSLYKKSNESLWQVVDQDQQEISTSQIKTVYFERNGDLVSQTVNGTKVVILNSGSLTTK